MLYTLGKIRTKQDCDVLLARALKKKRMLERSRRRLGESIDTFRQRLDYISQESGRLQTSMAALTTAHQAMPEGKEKMTIYIMIKRMEVRLAVLEKRAYTCNVAALLVKELRCHALDSQVAAMEQYIAVLEQRSAEVNPAVVSDLNSIPRPAESIARFGTSTSTPAASYPPDLTHTVRPAKIVNMNRLFGTPLPEAQATDPGVAGQTRNSAPAARAS